MYKLKENFGRNLKFTRKARGLTQEALGKLINLNQRQLTRLENGMNFPSVETLENLCKELNVPLKQLFNFSSITESKFGGTPTYKAIKFDTIYRLTLMETIKDQRLSKYNNKSILVAQADNSFSKISTSVKHSITVEFMEYGDTTRTTIYFPDGSLKDLYINISANDFTKRGQEIITHLKDIDKDPIKFELATLALKAHRCTFSRHRLMGILNNIERMNQK